MSTEAILSTCVGALGILVTIVLYANSGYKQRIKELETELKEIRKDYVRRDDMRSELTTVTKSVDEIKDGMKQLLGLVLAAGKFNQK